MKALPDNTALLKYQCDAGQMEIPAIQRGKELLKPCPFAIGDRVTSSPLGRWKVEGNIWGTVKEVTDNQNGYLRFMILWDNVPSGNLLPERLQDIII